MDRDRRLESQLDELQQLDQLRSKARELRGRGIAGLSQTSYAEGIPGWHDPGDDVEKALLVTAALAVPEQARRSDLLIRFGLRRLRELSLSDLFDCEFGYREKDHVPVLRAASVLEALSAQPETVLSRGATSCFVRILYAINTAGPDELLGGASAGAPGTPQTACITWRCVRALVSFAQAFERTAEFTNHVAKLRAQKPKGLPAAWWEVEQKARALGLQVSAGALKPFLFRNAADGPPEARDAESLHQWNEKELAALKQLPDKLDDTDVATARRKVVTQQAENQQSARESAAFDRALQIYEEFRRELRTPAAGLANVAIALQAAAKVIRAQFVPVEIYLRSVLDHELASPTIQTQRNPDAAELLFAASGLAHLGSVDRQAVTAALDRITPVMTNNGRIPSHKPFDVASKGYVLHVAGAEVLHAFSDLAARVSYPITHEVARRVLAHFTETARSFGDNVGWRHERDGAAAKCYWWLTALSIDALASYQRMLDKRINQIVFTDLSVRQPGQLPLTLTDLFYPDYGLAAADPTRTTIAIEFLKMQAHIAGVDVGRNKLHSAILFGPPGTGKTTLVEALAKSAGVPLVEITPSDILLGGEQEIETRARTVFNALSMLSDVVILMDEFDRVLWDRGQSGEAPSIYHFLTPGMLPKLKALHGHSKQQRAVFVLSTNLIGGLDPAAIRRGRFDQLIGVYPPDALSREGRLHLAFHNTLDTFAKARSVAGAAMSKEQLPSLDVVRFRESIEKTAGGGMDVLGKSGWFSADTAFKPSTLLGYLVGSDAPEWPQPEKELPATPTADYPRRPGSTSKFPNKHATEEWLEWLFVTVVDRLKLNGAAEHEQLIRAWNATMSSKSLADAERLCHAPLAAPSEKPLREVMTDIVLSQLQ